MTRALALALALLAACAHERGRTWGGPAVADITVLGEDGPVEVPALRGLTVRGGQTTTVALADVVPRRDELTLQVRVTRGRLSALARLLPFCRPYRGLIALTFTVRPELATIQVGLLNLNDQYGSTQYGPLFAAISINIVALLIVFVFLNKKIMAGLAAGSLKG